MKKSFLYILFAFFSSTASISFGYTANDLIGVMKGDEVTQVVAEAFGIPVESSGEGTDGWSPGEPQDSASWEQIGRQFGILSLEYKSGRTIDYIKFISTVRYEYKRLLRIDKTCALKFQNGVNQTNPEFPW